MVFRHACKLGLEGIVSKRQQFQLSFGAITALDQVEKSAGAGGEAGSRRGVGPMAVRKSETFPLVTWAISAAMAAATCSSTAVQAGAITAQP